MNCEFTSEPRTPAPARAGWVQTSLLLVLLGGATGRLGAQEAVTEPAPPLPLGRAYQDFQPINDRNIFNPNRTARSREIKVEPEKPKEPKIDVVALTGTLSYAQGSVAFFDSTSGEFRKAAKVGDQIAGYRLKEIAQSQVALEHESQVLELKVGQQLRRQDEGAWEVTNDAVVSGSASASSRSTRRESSSGRNSSSNGSSRREDATVASVPPADTATTASSPGEGPSEVLKRLLEQRKKEQSP